MSRALIELVGEDVLCAVVGGGPKARLPFVAAAGRLTSWASRYDAASSNDREDDLAAIGREMFTWLDGAAGWASAWVGGPGDWELEIQVQGHNDAREIALLDAPWELLARNGVPLALDTLRLFIVSRRIGAPAAAWTPRHSDLQLMFMAAAPEGEVDLDFEREEAEILEAARSDGRVHVVVEETGTLKFLKGRLASDEGPFQAVHLLCHGDIDEKRGPVLLLETAEGAVDPVSPGHVVNALGAEPPPLVVLSACRTAERGQSRGMAGGIGRRDAPGASYLAETRRDAGPRPAGTGAELTASFARQLATQVANVVGWGGSVYDRDATDFAKVFFSELGLRSPVPRAAASARQTLLNYRRGEPRRGRHWHLVRVYLGLQGGGPLCAAGKPQHEISAKLLEKAFLDKAKRRVPVATRAEFVGRRRAIQSVLRAFRDGSGVLVHGMAALGKSSLAARVASRTPRRPVVVFKRYDALAVLDEILTALPPAQRAAEKAAWREQVETDPACLAEALESWLAGPLNAKPVLLIIDDLERALETPRPDDTDAAVTVAADYRTALGAVLRAFARAQTASQLLLTSRYDFRLPDGAGGDLAADLVRVPLAPMPPLERAKQLRAAERLVGREALRTDAAAWTSLARALQAAAGNPFLQAILTEPILKGNLAAAEQALAQISVYRETGAPPAEIQASAQAGTASDSGDALTSFFKRSSFATYLEALTPAQERQLAAATLFAEEVPVPRAALEAAGAALGVEDAAAAVDRLLALGLLDSFAEIGGDVSCSINTLARSLPRPLESDEKSRAAVLALRELEVAWGSEISDVQQAELSRLLKLKNAPFLSETAEFSANGTLMRLALRKTLTYERQKFADLLFVAIKTTQSEEEFVSLPETGGGSNS